MTYNFNGKNLRIPDEDINRSMNVLGLSKDEAIQLWLEDEGYLENEVVEELTAKAKENKVQKGAKSDKPRKKTTRERKPDLEKEEIVKILAECLKNTAEMTEINIHDIKIVNKSKLLQFSIGENRYKLDLIKKRPPKS